MSDRTYPKRVGQEDKVLVWLKGEVTTPPFTQEARREAGALLRQLQQGVLLELPHSRPMPSIGTRCHELRITDKDRIWRIIYRIEPDAIVILEIFMKKDRATPRLVIEEGKARLARYLKALKREDAMDKAKRAKLEAAGWAVGTPTEFLNLSTEDETFINMKVALAATLRKQRTEQHLSQVAAAKKLKSSQSRVAKMELADRTVTVDLLIRSILKLGGTREMVAAALCH